MSLESRVHLHPEVLKLSTALNNPRCTVTTASQVRVCRLGAQLRGCHVASNAQDPGLIPSTEKKKISVSNYYFPLTQTGIGRKSYDF